MMGLTKNEEGNNFYPVFIPEVDWHCDYLWSTHRGCGFDCIYCSSKRLNKRFKSMGDPTMPKMLKGEWEKMSLGSVLKRRFFGEKHIFVNPYCDIMSLPKQEIKQILGFCHDSNSMKQTQFIFQTKDPIKYFDYLDMMPVGRMKDWLGITIETDDILNYNDLRISKAPNLANRFHNFNKLKHTNDSFKYFVTIEPVMKPAESSKTYGRLIFWMKELHPDLIFIGCDSGKNNLPEPTRDELIELIEQLKQITTVHVKSNAQRILGDMTLHNWFEVIKKM